MLALIRGDLNGSIEDPIVGVAGYDHSPLLGLVEIALGVSLLLTGVMQRPAGVLLVSAVTIVMAVVALIEPTALSSSLEIEAGLSWLSIALAALPTLALLLVPTTLRKRRGA